MYNNNTINNNNNNSSNSNSNNNQRTTACVKYTIDGTLVWKCFKRVWGWLPQGLLQPRRRKIYYVEKTNEAISRGDFEK